MTDRKSQHMAEPLRHVLGLFLIIVGIAFWTAFSFKPPISAESVLVVLETLRHEPWMLPAVLGLYLLCGFCFFPLLILAAATAAVFGPFKGFLIALSGALMSASLAYLVARTLTKEVFLRRTRPVAAKLRHYIQQGGFIGVAFLRALPLFPFTVTNFGLGMLGLRYRTYLLGTFLGLLPGIAVFTLLGNSFAAIFKSPDAHTLSLAAAGVVAWLLLLLGSHSLARRLGFAG